MKGRNRSVEMVREGEDRERERKVGHVGELERRRERETLLSV